MESPYRYDRTRTNYEVRQGPDLICTCDNPVIAGRIVTALNAQRRRAGYRVLSAASAAK